MVKISVNHKVRRVAQIVLVIVTAVHFSACSESFNDLDKTYGQDRASDINPIPADTFTITSQRYAGVTSFHGTATIRISGDKVELTPGAPFLRSLSIPASDIEYCGMTCFGTSDPRVDLLIPRLGANITIKNKTEMLDWCWANRKAVLSGKDERNWQYNMHPLPPQSSYATQLSSRKNFDDQAYQSCLGY